MRSIQIGKTPNLTTIDELGLQEHDMKDMYRLLAIAKYENRFVIPASHKELVTDLYNEQGSCGLAFAGSPGACGTL